MPFDIYDGEEKFLDITFDRVWDYISTTRKYLENILKLTSFSEKDIARIIIAASELMENSIRYSDKEGVRISIKTDEKNNNVQLTVYNYTTDKEAGILLDKLTKMNKKDPLEYYLALMKDPGNLKSQRSGLGLARIYHETKAKLDAEYFKKDGIVKVNALFKL
jgi:hypothetical protein